MLNVQLAMPGGAEWLIILAIVILVFGAAKLPDLARSSGQALRIFKSETKALKNEEKDDDEVSGEIVTESVEPEVAPVDRGDEKA